MTLVQVVPALPPPLEGVGSYALALAQALGIHGRFVVGDPGWQGQGSPADDDIAVVPARGAAVLEQVLARDESAVALLHYANYGYARRGCPDWLVAGLERWRNAASRRRLVTFFHEVHATGPPWRSSFWLAGRQRRLAMRLARLSDGVATSLDLYAGIVAPWSREPPVVLPVFSTVGEPVEVPALEERCRRLVLFGGTGARQRAYGSLRRQLEDACRLLEVEEVTDVGPPMEAIPEAVASRRVQPLGPLPPGEVSRVLSQARAGFLAYPPAFLAKSTVFAAYAAHGVLPVCAWHGPAAASPPQAGHHYWRPGEGPPPGDPQAVADGARSWYSGHRLDRQVETFRRLLER